MDTQEPENVIFAYTDAEAVDDGVLVAIRCGPVSRVTRAVFDHFTASMGSSPVTGPVTDVGRLMRAIESMLKLEADMDGWRTGAYEGKTFMADAKRGRRTHADVSGGLVIPKQQYGRGNRPASAFYLKYFSVRIKGDEPRMQRETVSVLVENLEKRQRALKVSEVAELFQVSPMTIYRAAKEGSLPSFKVGSSLRFDPKAIIAWLKRQMCLLNPV